MDKDFFLFLKEKDVEIQKEVPISKISCLGIGGNAKLLAMPNSMEKLVETVDALNRINIKSRVLGNMTNVLVPDEGFDGVVVKTSKINSYTVAENHISISCGANFSSVIKNLSNLGIGGFEKLYGIPGSLGGMIYSNAGAFGSEISDRLIRALLYSKNNKKFLTLKKEDMKFGYRSSILKHSDLLLLSADFSYEKSSSAEVKNKIDEIKNKRKLSQPISSRSLGSVFKRADGIIPAKLIDALGLKGYSIGGAQISAKHAGFIVNSGGATAEDFINLKEYIKNRVYEVYGVILEEEIEILC